MKRFFITITVWLMLVALVVPSFIPTVSAAEKTVGSEADFSSAIRNVSNGDTVKVSGTITFSSNFVWHNADKSIKITGGTLDFSAISELTIGTGVTFDATTVKFKSGGTVFANGKKVAVSESVTVTNSATIYGGKNGGTLDGDTDLTLMSGVYSKIYGGSKGGTINGNTNITVGGKVNEGVDWKNHNGSNNIYGGGNGCVINGDTNLIVGGNALANYIFGGSEGGSSKISGRSNFTFGGNAKAMSLYGASNTVNTGNDVNLIMAGGEVQQVFGGVQGQSLGSTSQKVDVKIRLLGGKITRRVYGGCYNEYELDGGGWEGSHNVFGNIILTFGKNVNITQDYIEYKDTGVLGIKLPIQPDNSLFARSRRQQKAADENAIIIYLAENATDTGSGSAYKKYSGKIGLSLLKPDIDSGVTAFDESHVIYYTSDATSITENCILDSCKHTAKITVSRSATDSVYTGSPIEFAKVTKDGNWKSGATVEGYKNNVMPGNASFSLECAGITLTLDCVIKKKTQSKPTLAKADETYKGKGDGKIYGLSTNMQYSTNKSGPYIDISNTEMDFAPGKYFIRIKGDEVHDVSAAVEITIGAGEKMKITFKADGEQVTVRELEWGEVLTNIPDVPLKDGYVGRWSVTNFTNIQGDKTVVAIYTKEGEEPAVPQEPEDPNEPQEPEENDPNENVPDDNGVENAESERATEDKKPTETDKNTEENREKPIDSESGCGSTVFGGAVVVAAALGFAALRKKED